MNKKHLILFLTILFYSCSFDKQKGNTNAADSMQTNSVNQPDTMLNNDAAITDTTENVNYTDQKGLRQGKWIKKWKGKIIEVSHYKNDTLNGYFRSLENGDGYEGNFVRGKREGLFYSWYVYKKLLRSVQYFEKDSSIWIGFPAADEKFLFPIKGFHITKDSVFIRAPYENGKTWYEGHFCLRQSKLNKGLMTYAYGVHNIYFKSGQLKGIVDYSNEIIQEFDSTGNELYKAKFKEYNIHKQPISHY